MLLYATGIITLKLERRMFMDKTRFSKPVDLMNIIITDSFWKAEMELVRKEVIPYQWEALNDRVAGAEPSYCMHNFKVAGKLNKQRDKEGKDFKQITYPTDKFILLPEDPKKLDDKFYGFVFQDSDFYKWIEAVGYSLSQHPDTQLERIADEAIDIVCQAQQPNGYLDTYYIINDISKIFTNLKDHHELYCFGHLTEGAVAYYQATGKKKLLDVAIRYADYIDTIFGIEEGKCKGYPGHEIAEMALVRLYEVTGNEKYLKLSRFFITQRGTKPYYYDQEHLEEGKDLKLQRYQYYQAHLPVYEQEEAVGHAVRAVYLYSGMADVARLTNDDRLYQSCLKLWESITLRKMYITGGIGATHMGEAFSFDYDLPNDTAYAETCASIGLVFFARRLLEIKPDAKISSVMERALYNGILSGMALDGKSFFYVNPLEVDPHACAEDERKQHVKATRQKWFGCACCPPNIARLLSSIGSYAYTETEDVLYIHQYIGAHIKKQVKDNILDIIIESELPWDGTVKVSVNAKEATTCTIAIRIPDWSSSYQCYELNQTKEQQGKSQQGKKNPIEGHQSEKKEFEVNQENIQDGYLYITREWIGESTVCMDFQMEIKLMEANPYVREDIGKIAITRGPIVYCLEEVDNGPMLHLLTFDKNQRDHMIAKEEVIGSNKIIALYGRGKKLRINDTKETLYHEITDEYQDVELKWIPYYAWANRGEGEMSVWIRSSGEGN